MNADTRMHKFHAQLNYDANDDEAALHVM